LSGRPLLPHPGRGHPRRRADRIPMPGGKNSTQLVSTKPERLQPTTTSQTRRLSRPPPISRALSGEARFGESGGWLWFRRATPSSTRLSIVTPIGSNVRGLLCPFVGGADSRLGSESHGSAGVSPASWMGPGCLGLVTTACVMRFDDPLAPDRAYSFRKCRRAWCQRIESTLGQLVIRGSDVL
jgi:hypothetical protein